jgi:ribosomal protein L14
MAGVIALSRHADVRFEHRFTVIVDQNIPHRDGTRLFGHVHRE